MGHCLPGTQGINTVPFVCFVKLARATHSKRWDGQHKILSWLPLSRRDSFGSVQPFSSKADTLPYALILLLLSAICFSCFQTRNRYLTHSHGKGRIETRNAPLPDAKAGAMSAFNGGQVLSCASREVSRLRFEEIDT